MNIYRHKVVLLVFWFIVLLGCGGPRINTKPQELSDHGAMTVLADPHMEISLNHILYRNSPGSWAKDANWDEYILSVKSREFPNDITIVGIYIEDLMGVRHANETTRKELNQSTRAIKKKYKKAGYKIKIGAGSTHASVAGVSVAIGSGVAAGAVTATGSIGTLTSVGVGAAVAVPALVISGVTKLVYNARVSKRIQERQTALPTKVNSGPKYIDLLFPAVPLPQKLIISYTHQTVPHQMELDLTQVTKGLHIKN